MEAPEKLYLFEGEPILSARSKKREDANIEYTRTDVFIERACKWIFNQANIYTKLTVDSHDGSVYTSFYSDKMIEDFKKAMTL